MSIADSNTVAVCFGSLAIILLVLFVNSLRSDYLSRKKVNHSEHVYKSFDNQQDNDHCRRVDHNFYIWLCWPLIILLGKCLLPFMTWGARQRIARSINQAGLYSWTCSQFLAFQCLLAGLVAMFCFGISLMLLTLEKSDLFYFCFVCAVMAGAYPRVWLRTRKRLRFHLIEKGLPFFLDLVTLGLEAGLNLQSAVQLSLDHLPAGPLKQEWSKTVFEIRSGVTRAEAFQNMSQRVELPCIRQMVSAFIQGESMGLSLSRSIGEFSRQQGKLRLLRAEKTALQAPVKMLFPLAFCIFPCTFLVLGFPVVAQLLGLES